MILSSAIRSYPTFITIRRLAIVLSLVSTVSSRLTPGSHGMGGHDRPFLQRLKGAREEAISRRISNINLNSNSSNTHTDQSTYEKRGNIGRFTYYETGQGACGGFNSDDEYVVALNQPEWDGGSHCFKMISISYGGKTTKAQIVDECPSCPPGALDFSMGLFKYFADLDEGVIYGEWDYLEKAKHHTTSINTPKLGPKTESDTESESSSSTKTQDITHLTVQLDEITRAAHPTSSHTDRPLASPPTRSSSRNIVIGMPTPANNNDNVLIEQTTDVDGKTGLVFVAGSVTLSGVPATGGITDSLLATTIISDATSTVTGLGLAASIAAAKGGDVDINNGVLPSPLFPTESLILPNSVVGSHASSIPGTNSINNGVSHAGQNDMSNDGPALQALNGVTDRARSRSPSRAAQVLVLATAALSLIINTVSFIIGDSSG